MSDAVSVSRDDLHAKMDQLIRVIGAPTDGDHKATGLCSKLEELDHRLTPFEDMREQATGGLKVITLLVPAFALVLWFMIKEKIHKLLGL